MQAFTQKKLNLLFWSLLFSRLKTLFTFAFFLIKCVIKATPALHDNPCCAFYNLKDILEYVWIPVYLKNLIHSDSSQICCTMLVFDNCFFWTLSAFSRKTCALFPLPVSGNYQNLSKKS